MTSSRKNIPTDKIINDITTGMTQSEIAKKYNISQGQVSKIAKRNGLKPPRGRGERGTSKQARPKKIENLKNILKILKKTRLHRQNIYLTQ